jgi:hypothetical protein
MPIQLSNEKLYKIGYLFYGSIFSDIDPNEIIDGPFIPVRLSGIAFPNTKNIKLTRNLHPKGNPIKSSIYIKSTSNIKSTINNLSYREYYENFDQEPICYFKRKPNNKSVLKIPFYNSYIDISDVYQKMVSYLYLELNKISNNYNLDYIFFISYDHRIDLLGIDHKLSEKEFNKKLLKLIVLNLGTKSNKFNANTKKYLKLCDKSTYTWIEHFIISI